MKIYMLNTRSGLTVVSVLAYNSDRCSENILPNKIQLFTP